MEQILKIGIVPLRRTGFNLEAAKAEKARLLKVLESYNAEWIDVDDVVPDGIASCYDEAEPIIKKLRKFELDGLFFPHMDFGTEFLAGKIAATFKLPILVWGNSDGEIVNNQLVRYTQCGLFATGKILRDFHRPFDYIVACPPESRRFARGMDNFLRVCSILRSFNGMRIMQIATRPEPFWSVKCNEQELLERFGIEVFPITLSEMVSDVKAMVEKHPDRIKEKLHEVAGNLNTCEVCKDQLDRVMALTMVLEDYFKRYGLSSMAVQCWSALQDELCIMPCSTFGLLCDQMLPVACETDIKGAVGASMLQAAEFNRQPIFFSDITIQHPTNPNANLLWHCGNFPASKARAGQELCMMNHPLQAPFPGAVGAWELMGGDITINRFDSQDGEYTMLIGQGRAVDGPKVNGTYVWMEVDNWPKWEHRLVTGPYIHHVSGIYGSVAPALYSACKYIDGLKPDLLDPDITAINNYLWDR